jgi:predicted CXXCH cytochrome family protein
MRKILCLAIVLITVLAASTLAFAAAEFKVLAPAEEAFISTGEILIIGKVIGFNEAKMVEISDSGKTLGFVPLRKGTFSYRSVFADGRHEITLAAPGVERKAIKIFVGKQKGYRYHIETDLEYCSNCHSGAADHVFDVEAVQSEICEQCHDPMGAKDIVHGPVAAGSCSPCHDPHGSRYDKFLVAVGKELCLVCHSQNLSKRHIEERQNADCVKCHDPHSSAKEYHLR